MEVWSLKEQTVSLFNITCDVQEEASPQRGWFNKEFRGAAASVIVFRGLKTKYKYCAWES